MKIIDEKHLSEKENEKYDALIKMNEVEWEIGDYGKNEKYMVRARPEEEKKIKNIIGKKPKQKTYSIKMPDDLVEKLKLIASEKHIGYQTLLKIIASDFINKNIKNAHEMK